MNINPIPFKSGFISLVGRPNVGKSTLLNLLMDQKIAAVSPRPQTTRRKQLGILSNDSYQIIFMDTPGIHQPHHKLGEYMNEVATATLKDADVILWIVDAAQAPNEEDKLVAARMATVKELPPVILILNKEDQVKEAERPARQSEYLALLPAAKPMWISALRPGCKTLVLDDLLAHLPDGVPFYDPEQITDLYERDIAADLIREAALIHLRDEIPHAIAVRVDDFIEQSESNAHITATILVERESHKGIVIGKGGEMIKKIGSLARQEIEKMSGRKVFLELRVKEKKNWRNDPESLRLLGYEMEKEN
ncbi:MAG: GTPase Era [Anaerolineae bacterium]|nr:GTPase Era [Anaerolineae bacterium]